MATLNRRAPAHMAAIACRHAPSARLGLSLGLSSVPRPTIATAPRLLNTSLTQSRFASNRKQAYKGAVRARIREKKLVSNRRKVQFKEYKYATPESEEQYSLCDAMRYLRAAEVGNPPKSVSYELSLRVRTKKNTPLIRGDIELPYPVKAKQQRIAVICKEGSKAMADARDAGAVAWGEEPLFELIRNEPKSLPFNRLICHVDSEAALKTANLGKLLGPKGLMPNAKSRTITKDIKAAMRPTVGKQQYRERFSVIRITIGNIEFDPKQLSQNIKVFVAQVQDNIVDMEDLVNKTLIEVILSTSRGPGFSLNGLFNPTDPKISTKDLSTAM